MKKLLSLLLALVLLCSLVACGGGNSSSQTSSSASSSTSSATSSESSETGEEPTESSPENSDVGEETGTYQRVELLDVGDVDNYDTDLYSQQSEMVYDLVLGEFADAYATAKEEHLDADRLHCLQAIAEAKMLDSAAFCIGSASGGQYYLSRFVYYSGGWSGWGGYQGRYPFSIVTEEPTTKEQHDEIEAKHAELVGTGTFREWLEGYIDEQGLTRKDTLNITYSTDPQTWDPMNSSRSVDGAHRAYIVENLILYDDEGNYVGGMATEPPEVSEDGLTWTFHLREGLVWVDQQGREIQPLTADDYVAGLQHVCDSASGLSDLVDGKIVNLSEYIAGDITDFSEVGVKAEDDHTLVYTLEDPCTYFDTMFGYSWSMPLPRKYYESNGGTFGAEYDSSASTYLWGTDPAHIAYCGPYLITNATEKAQISFSANPTYYAYDDMTVTTVNWLYNDGSDTLKAYQDFKAGTIDICSLTTEAVESAQKDTVEGGSSYFDTYAWAYPTGVSTFLGSFNLARIAYHNQGNENELPSWKLSDEAGEDEIDRTQQAILNKNFRHAFIHGMDRISRNAQSVGDDIAAMTMRNSYTPANFVSLTKETTVEINGEEVTFPAGTNYGEIMQAQLDADGADFKVWDDSLKSGDGFDGWYDPAKCKADLDKAAAELAQIGITVDADHPIHIDLPYRSDLVTSQNAANAVKQSVESASEGRIIVDVIASPDLDTFQKAQYLNDVGALNNYDMMINSGWGPDYGDPATYLDTMLGNYEGYMVMLCGIF